MKNITVSIDEETHRLARIRAAKLDTSVSDLVREYLKSLVADRAGDTASNEPDVETDAERRRRMLREVFEAFDARAIGLRMSDNLTREELYDRARARAEAQAAAVAEDEDLKHG